MNKLYIYNSLSQWSAELNAAPTNKIFKNPTSQKKGDSDWAGTDSYKEADDLLLHGDHDSAKLIRDSAPLKAPATGTVKRQRPTTAITGYLPHVPNYLAGRPDSMITTRTEPRKAKIIDIVFLRGVSSWWSTSEIAENSAKIVSAIKAIEAGGIRVNLWVMFSSVHGNESANAIIKVKDSGRYLETEKLGYCLINPGMHRRHNFKFIETRAESKDSGWGAGYGRPAHDDEAERVLKENHIKYNKLISLNGVRDLSAEDVKKLFTA